MGVVSHRRLDTQFSKIVHSGRCDREALPIANLGHTCHGDTTTLIFSILIEQNGTLTAGSDRVQTWMPAKVGQLQV